MLEFLFIFETFVFVGISLSVILLVILPNYKRKMEEIEFATLQKKVTLFGSMSDSAFKSLQSESMERIEKNRVEALAKAYHGAHLILTAHDQLPLADSFGTLPITNLTVFMKAVEAVSGIPTDKLVEQIADQMTKEKK